MSQGRPLLYPNWKELVNIIVEQEQVQQGNFYSDEDIAVILEDNVNYQWMRVCAELSKKHGVDFIRVKYPVKGYKAMTDEEKIHIGFKKRMGKTRRNFRRMAQVAGSVNRNALSENDARAHDTNMAKIGLLGMAFVELNEGAKNLKLTIEIDRELPRLK